jgi:ribosomal protein S4
MKSRTTLEVEAAVETTPDGKFASTNYHKIGLADSVSDASRKLKQKSVKVNGEVVTAPVAAIDITHLITVQVGRKIKKVRAASRPT